MRIDHLLALAKECGFQLAGVCSASGFDAQKELVDAQPALAERRQLRFFPQEECPWATALLVLCWPYKQAPIPKAEGEVFIDSYYYASNAAYHAANALEARLIQMGYQARANVSFPAREAAVRAGLGIVGHNGLLITPEYGTRVVIILLATDAVASPHDARQTKSCAQCGKCIAACPMGAIDEKGMSHPERCLRNFMMEGIVAPEEARHKMGMRLIGCDNCQRACPMQPVHEEAGNTPLLLDDLLTDDPIRFKQAIALLGSQIGRNTARPQRVRAQAALLAGHTKNPAYLPVLHQWAQSDFDAVAAHANWAIQRIQQADTSLSNP